MLKEFNFKKIDSDEQSIVFLFKNQEIPSLIYWGDKLSSLVEIKDLAYEENPILFGAPDKTTFLNLFPQSKNGWINQPPLIAYNDAYNSQASNFQTKKVTIKKNRLYQEITFFLQDQQVHLSLNFKLFKQTNILTANSTLSHKFNQPLKIAFFSNPVIPCPERHQKVKYWSGKWCGEFSPQEVPWPIGKLSLTNRTGRTSHEFFPGMISALATTDEEQGECLGATLAWSGNWFIEAEKTSFDEKVIFSGVHYLPNEKQINSTETITNPELFLVKSNSGYNSLSHSFHSQVRTFFLKKQKSPPIRKVNFNSWEAIYFNHDFEKITKLVELSRKIGVERFVLDDGWFKGRNDDNSSLGDWEIDRKKYPNGFKELVEVIEKNKLDFGLWVEPEMINPKSQLFERHPDWILGDKNQLAFRNQLVLNFSLKEVQDYIFQCLDSLLQTYPIRYLKWDMNRYYLDPFYKGKIVAEKQVKALYNFFVRLRKKHPKVEIESCASGGARIDYGVLKYTNRFWLSDHNGFHDRANMHYQASYFFPPEVFGAHAHPAPSHTSGRVLTNEFMIHLASFTGHLGLELDLTVLSEAELTVIKKGIALYKKFRAFLHSAKFYRLKINSKEHLATLYLKEDTFILVIAQLRSLSSKMAPNITIPYLTNELLYSIKLISSPKNYASAVREQKNNFLKGITLSGRVLQEIGFRMPSGWPNQVWVYSGTKKKKG